MDIKFLDAEKGDVDRISELSYQVGKMHDDALPDYFKPTSEEEHRGIIQNMIADKNAVVLKAVCDEQICGFACLYIQENQRKGYVHSKVAYIYNFGVDEKYRGNGIGTQLLRYSEDVLVKMGIESVELGVFVFNKNAYEFYLKNGYNKLEINMHKVLVD